jgi:uncharacterized RDD family membrane protein YckC
MQVISFGNVYASGMRRLAAFFIDYILLNIVVSVFLWQAFDFPWGFGWDLKMLTGNFISHVVIIIYYALMESSHYQATFGKIALGIKVVNHNGQRLTFQKALLRNVSKIISSILFGIGFIMIVFDSRKQGLHDKIADTFTVEQ